MKKSSEGKMANRLVAYWRAFRGVCPRCNSDAPAIDTCKACEGWRGSFPPPNWLAATWLMRHFEPQEWSSK